MLEDHLLENEQVIVDFTPNKENLLKIQKVNYKLSRVSILVFIFVFGLIAIVSGTLIVLPPLILIFLPLIIGIYYYNKKQIKCIKVALSSKYILTDKRCIIFNTETNTMEYILFENLAKVRPNQQNGFTLYSFSKNRKPYILNYINVDSVDSILTNIYHYKKY